uniref:PB1 domain-containing protein n=1 Tax=Pygocentrus nattereri TaxID=42514 RepID=A0AAR2LEI7_PYGNA
MASSTTMRVILTEDDVRKLKLTSRPSSVADLIMYIKDSLGLEYDFTLQFQDPEFDNELCNLTDLSELLEKPTVKIIPVLHLVSLPSSLSENLNDTVSTADTELLSTSSTEARKPWPDDFLITKFSVDVEYRFRQGNLNYLKEGTYLKVSIELKHDILHRLAETIYSFKAYPTTHDLNAVARALIAAHPCLQEPTSPSGCCGWKNSLKDKMGNYRSKMRALGHEDVKVNAEKRGRNNPNGEPAHKNIKKPKKGEVNYLPNIPDGHNNTSLEDARKQFVDKMKKKNPDGTLINQKMDVTLSLRRKEVVQDKPPVIQMLQRWPALFVENQVYQEFNRVVGKNLKQEFYDSLDRHCPALVDVMKSKRGLKGQLLDALLHKAQVCELNSVNSAMCLLFGLTYALYLNYPKCMVNTFQFVQQVFLGLGRKELKTLLSYWGTLTLTWAMTVRPGGV